MRATASRKLWRPFRLRAAGATSCRYCRIRAQERTGAKPPRCSGKSWTLQLAELVPTEMSARRAYDELLDAYAKTVRDVMAGDFAAYGVKLCRKRLRTSMNCSPSVKPSAKSRKPQGMNLSLPVLDGSKRHARHARASPPWFSKWREQQWLKSPSPLSSTSAQPESWRSSNTGEIVRLTEDQK